MISGGTLAGQDTLLVLGDEDTGLPYASVFLLPQRQSLGSTGPEGALRMPAGLVDSQLVAIRFLGFEDADVTYGELAANGFVYRMRPSAVPLVEFTVPLEVVGRRNEVSRDLPYQTEAIGRAALRRAQSLTTADALADLSGVYVQKSQFGGGSPVVRGFEANRVLLVVDGVRMNNAIFRGGHLQNAITVDPLALDKLEVIYGAGALAYGTDAVGGVVYFRTRQPDFARPRDAGWRFQGAVNASSAARAFGQSVSLEYRRENFAALTLFSQNRTSHLRAGAQRPAKYRAFGLRNEFLQRANGVDRTVRNERPNVQIGTAYQQYNLLQKLRFRLHDAVELSANFQYTTTSDVPRYDALTERRDGNLRWARWDYGPQTRALAAVKLSDRRGTRFYDVANYLLSHQHTAEDRIRRRRNDPNEENNLERVSTSSLQADYALPLSWGNLRYGFDLRYDRVNSTAFLRNVDNGSTNPGALSTRYPSGGSALFSGGAYAEAEHELRHDLKLRGGLRWSRQRLNARFGAADPIAWPQTYLDGIKNTESAVTAALGLVRERNGNRYRLLFAQGFRAPNIDDFAKFREQNGFVQVPNPTLQPERSNTLEAGYRLSREHGNLSAEATAYHTWLNNAIIRRDGTLPDGRRSFVSRGDTLFAQTNVNAESARVYGFDLALRYRTNNNWRFATSVHYLRGRRKQLAPDGAVLDLPQDHIPPPYGKATIGWARDRWDLSFRLRYQLAKRPEDYAVGEILGDAAAGYTFDRTGTADNLELTPLASDASFTFTGSYAWWTANLYAEYTLTDRLTLRLKGENLLDRHYRTFASGVSAPGIDIRFGVTGKF